MKICEHAKLTPANMVVGNNYKGIYTHTGYNGTYEYYFKLLRRGFNSIRVELLKASNGYEMGNEVTLANCNKTPQDYSYWEWENYENL